MSWCAYRRAVLQKLAGVSPIARAAGGGAAAGSGKPVSKFTFKSGVKNMCAPFLHNACSPSNPPPACCSPPCRFRGHI